MTILAGGIACLMGSVPAHGGILYEQGFEGLSPGGLSDQDGFKAMSQAQVAAGGLTYTNGEVFVDGGARCVSFTGLPEGKNNWVFSRGFAPQSGPVYFTIAMSWVDINGADMLLFALSDDVHTSTPVALGNSAGVNINLNNTHTAGLINGRIRANSTAATTCNKSPTSKAGGETTSSPQFIVGCVDKNASANYNRLRLWINPEVWTETEPDVLVERDLLISELRTFFFFSGADNYKNGGPETVKVDSIRVGTAWEDVMPPPYVAPAPTLILVCGRASSDNPLPPAPVATYSEIAADGAYCWFADSRAIRFRSSDGTMERTFLGWVDRAGGDIRAMQYDHKTGTRSTVVIHENFERDDHDNPTFLVLPDERIMVFYSRHSNEKKIWYRVSTSPGDITSLGPACFLDTDHNVTYPTPYILSDDPNHIHLVWRGVEWHPTIARLAMPTAANNYTTTFDAGPYQIVRSAAESSGKCRPYAKYVSDGKNRIYLAYSATHPDNVCPTMLYGGYVDINDLSLHALDGATLDANLATDPIFVVHNNESFDNAPGWLLANDANVRHWVWQTALDADGAFYVLFTKISKNKDAHEYWYGKWADGAWTVLKLADAGGWFHQNPSTEKCYSAGLAFDSADPRVVYASIPDNGVYEIHRLTVSQDASRVVSNVAVTSDSDKNNVRPFVVAGSRAGDDLRLFWMHGDYYYWSVNNPSAQNDGYYTSIRTDFIFP